MSILLSAELEVDGDLKVTGSVESTTIDSLKAVIAQQQALIDSLTVISSSITTRLYSADYIRGENTNILMTDLTGVNRDWYLVRPLMVISPEGAYMIMDNYTANNLINFGSNVGISLQFSNVGSDPSINTQLLLFSDDEFVESEMGTSVFDYSDNDLSDIECIEGDDAFNSCETPDDHTDNELLCRIKG